MTLNKRISKHFVVYLLIPLASLMVILTFLGLFSEINWLGELSTHFVFQYVVFSAILMVLFLVFGRLRWAFVCFLIILINFGPKLTPYLVHKEPQLKDEDVILLWQYNARVGVPEAVNVVKQIVASNIQPDVLLFIEVSQDWESKLNLLKNLYPVYKIYYRENGCGIAMFSKLPNSSMKLLPLVPGCIPYIKLNAETYITRKPFELFGIHAQIPGPFGLTEGRDEQLNYLSNLISSSDSETNIIIGDFNITPWSPTWRKFLNHSGLRNAQIGFGLGTSWSPFGMYPLLAIPIDHTLVSEPIKVLNRTMGDHLGSDHRWILTKIGL